MAALVASRQARHLMSPHIPCAVRWSHQKLKNMPKPKERGDKALPIKVTNPTPSGFMNYDPWLEKDVTGREFGFAPTPHPLPPHETMWDGYQAKIIGHTPKKRGKKKCVGRMVFAEGRTYKAHGNICAFCRATAEQKSTNILFLMNFIHPISWTTYPWTVSGLCRHAEVQVRKLLEEARANGFLPRHPPPVTAGKKWMPPGEQLDMRHFDWYTRDLRKSDMMQYALNPRFGRMVKHKI